MKKNHGKTNARYLRLSPFEEYMFRDRRPGFPMTQELVWIFRGTFDEATLRRAFQTVVAVEPLFNAIVCNRYGRLYWKLSDSSLPELLVSDVTTDYQTIQSGTVPLTEFDLTQRGGIAVRIERFCDGFAVFTSVHHAVTDGLGITRFMGGWFAVYQRYCTGQNDVSDLLPDPTLFSQREKLYLRPPMPISFLTAIRGTLREIFQWFHRRAIPLAPLAQEMATNTTLSQCSDDLDATTTDIFRSVMEQPSPYNHPVLHWINLPASVLNRYKERAHNEHQSVNTLFLADLYFTLAQWIRERIPQQTFRKNHFFRLLIPTSLRSSEHTGMPMTNYIGYVFLDLLPQDTRTKQEIIEEIGTTMEFVQQWSTGVIFLEGVRLFRRIPFLLSFITSRRFCHCTFVFSNPGMICRVLDQPNFQESKTIRIDDELELIRIVGAPPVRPNTPLAIGLISNGSQTTLSFCLDEQSFSRSMLNEFIHRFLRHNELLFCNESPSGTS